MSSNSNESLETLRARLERKQAAKALRNRLGAIPSSIIKARLAEKRSAKMPSNNSNANEAAAARELALKANANYRAVSIPRRRTKKASSLTPKCLTIWWI